MRALGMAATALTEAPDHHTAPEAVVGALLQALGAEGCAVWRVSPQTPSLTSVLVVGDTPRAGRPSLPLNSLPGRVAATGRPTVVNAPLDDPSLEARGVHTVLCVPLRLPDGTMGAVEVVGKSDGPSFTEADLPVARAVVSHLAVALALKRDWSSHERRLQELEALVSIGELLNRETDPTAALEGLLRLAQEMVGAEAGFCLVFDSAGEHLRVVAAVGRDAQRMAGATIPVAESIEGWVAEQGETALIVNNTAVEPRARQGIASVLDYHVRNLLCVALRVGGEVYGTVELVNSARASGFGPEDSRLLVAMTTQGAVAVANFSRVERLRRAFMLTIECLSLACDTPSPDSQSPPQKVVPLARGVAETLGLSSLDQEIVVLAALLHDVAKLAIDQQLLQEPRRLTDRERTVVRAHPLIAAQFLEPLMDPRMSAIGEALMHHHEWVDGRGYPDGLQTERIPIASRIIAVVHAYCAMTEGRPYQPPQSPAEAIGELRRWAGSQFDPQVVEALVATVEHGPREQA